MRFYIVDAFADEIFGGNPAGVVLIPEGVDFPDDETCVRTAAELRYSETAFVKRLNEDEFNIRYFTPTDEVELCGHATIGSFAALRYGGHIDDGDFTNHTISGDLEIGVRGSSILMDMAAPDKIDEITDEDSLVELYGIMGLDHSALRQADPGLVPQMISTGLPDIIMPVSTLADLEAISPDFAALAELSRRYEVVGVHAFTREGDDATCHVRNFAPLYGIDEESATGTANGALTYYGYLNGFISPGDDCLFIQGEKMGRPSKVRSHIEVGETCRIRVGGSGVIVAEGEISI